MEVGPAVGRGQSKGPRSLALGIRKLVVSLSPPSSALTGPRPAFSSQEGIPHG